MSSLHPRVLLVGNEPFNYTQGYGITISNLFNNWSSDNLLCLYISDVEPDYTVCKVQIRIFDSCRTREFSTGCHQISQCTKRKLSQFVAEKFFKFLNRFGYCQKYNLNISLKERLVLFKPDLIFCSVTSLKEIKLVSDIGDLLGVPLVLYIVDDWIKNAIVTRKLYDGFRARRTSRELSKLIQRSRLNLVIGSDMSLVYERRYGVHFFPFQNCPESSLWIKHGRIDRSPSSPFRFLFTGGIYDSCNAKVILEFAQAIDFLNRIDEQKFVFEIHTQNQHVEKWSKILSGYKGCFAYKVKSNQKYMAKLYGSADALLLPFDFDDKARKASKYSMPTKLPVYLLSGAPIFGYGPIEIASIKFIQEHKCGFCLQKETSIKNLAESIEQFSRNTESREEYACNARNIGKELSAEVVRPRFLSILNGIVTQ